MCCVQQALSIPVPASKACGGSWVKVGRKTTAVQASKTLQLDKMETIDFHIRCCLSWFSSPALLQEHASKCSAKTENRLNSGKKEDQLRLTIVEPVQSFNEPTDEEIIPVHLI